MTEVDKNAEMESRPTGIKPTACKDAIVLLQTIKIEYNSNKSAPRASLLFVTVNGKYYMENINQVPSQSQWAVGKW